MKFKIKLSTLIFSIIFLAILGGIGFVLAHPNMAYTAITPLNSTVYGLNATATNTLINLSFSIDFTNISACTFDLNNSLVLDEGNWVNQTTVNLTNTYYNASNIGYLNESIFGQWWNVTYFCNETGQAGDGNISSGVYRFRVDYTSPDITSSRGTEWNFTQLNDSTHAYINVSFKHNDTNRDICRVRITEEDGSVSWEVAAENNATDESAMCSLTLDHSNITQTGDFTLEYWGNDSAGWTGFGTNQTGLVNILVASKWNLVSYSGYQNGTGFNESLKEIMGHLPNCTSISLWNNAPGNKSYITHTAAAPTVNPDYTVDVNSLDFTTFWIYCNNTDYYYRPNLLTAPLLVSAENRTLYLNTTTTDSSWNLIPLMQDKTLNDTLYADIDQMGRNVTVGQPKTSASANFTAIAWYNATLGHYITCVKLNYTHVGGQDGSLLPICTAGYNATTVTIPKAYPIWINVDANTTINMTAY